MSVEYLELANYLGIAVAVTGLDQQTVLNITNVGLADSALHAPAAGFGDGDFYPDFIDKVPVLVVRLARNHPLPDGNKRAVWVSLRLFVEINGWDWNRSDPSMTPSERCSRSPPASGTNRRPPPGCGTISNQPRPPNSGADHPSGAPGNDDRRNPDRRPRLPASRGEPVAREHRDRHPLAERLRAKRVATLDHRHVRVVRPVHVAALTSLP